MHPACENSMMRTIRATMRQFHILAIEPSPLRHFHSTIFRIALNAGCESNVSPMSGGRAPNVVRARGGWRATRGQRRAHTLVVVPAAVVISLAIRDLRPVNAGRIRPSPRTHRPRSRRPILPHPPRLVRVRGLAGYVLPRHQAARIPFGIAGECAGGGPEYRFRDLAMARSCGSSPSCLCARIVGPSGACCGIPAGQR